MELKQIQQLTGHWSKSRGGLNSFRCSMHLLDSIHKQCDKFITAHEHTLSLDKTGKIPFQKGEKVKPNPLLRSIDKSFHDSTSDLPQDLPLFEIKVD